LTWVECLICFHPVYFACFFVARLNEFIEFIITCFPSLLRLFYLIVPWRNWSIYRFEKAFFSFQTLGQKSKPVLKVGSLSFYHESVLKLIFIKKFCSHPLYPWNSTFNKELVIILRPSSFWLVIGDALSFTFKALINGARTTITCNCVRISGIQWLLRTRKDGVEFKKPARSLFLQDSSNWSRFVHVHEFLSHFFQLCLHINWSLWCFRTLKAFQSHL